MNTASREIIDAALKLPEPERVAIVETLLESLSPEANDGVDEAWVAELERRRAEYDQAPESAIPWSELKKQT